MPAQISSFFGRMLKSIREFTVAQRTIALIGVAVLVLGIVTFATWTAKPTYTPLFSGLQPSDANTIVEQLRTDGVPYELTGGGGTILVPEESVYDQRLKAAAAGLPSSDTGGYTLLDDMGVTSSEFQQSVTYKRAMEGELASTIGALKGVKTASVRLAIPEETVFVSEKADPTASVFVETDRGVTLASDQVQAVVHLTSASIQGMKPDDVAVIDAAGTVLSAVGVGATGGADKQASDYEQRVTTAVQTMLDSVVGAGNATVAVAADMSYESAERVDESFSIPDGDPALSESTETEGYNGAGGTAAGVLGPDDIAAEDAGDTGDGTFESESSVRNNALNKVTETTTIPAGEITRQSVSVAIDQAAAGPLNMEDITGLVASAAGINAERGDEVTVEVVPFNTAAADEASEALAAAAAAAAAERQAELIRTGLIIAAVLVVLIIALLLYARHSRRQRREMIDLGNLEELDDGSSGRHALGSATGPPALAASTRPAVTKTPVPQALGGAGQDPNPATSAFGVVPSGSPDGAEALPSATADMDRKRAEIDELAGRDPDKTAEYLRGLLDDRQSV